MIITHPGKRYVAMICALIVATLLRLVLLPAEAGLPFLTYYPTLVLVVMLAGLGPGVAFIGLSMAVGNYFFIPPWGFHWSQVGLVACGAYTVASSFMLAILACYQRQGARQSAQLVEASMILSEAQRVAHLGSFGFDAETRTIVWSEEESRIYGLDPAGAAPAYEEMLARCIHPDDVRRLREVFAKAVETGSVYELEHRVMRPDGSVRWVHNRARPYFDEQGKLLRYIGATLDITERKQAEEALRRSEARLRALVEASSDAVYRMSPDWTEMRHLVGRDFIAATPAPSRTWLQTCIDPDEQPRVAAAIEEAIRSKCVFKLAYRVQRVDGSPGWTFLRAIPMLDPGGEITEWFGMASDITERKAIEEELARTSSVLSEAQKIAHLGSFEYIAATRSTVWSEEEYRIYGLDPAGPAPAYDEMLATCIHPDDAPRLHEVFTQALHTGSIYELEHRIVRPDGGVRWVYDRAQPYFDEQGQLLRYIGATLDITGRRQAEEALRIASEDAKRANQAKSRFLAAASHDLRQPLSALSIYAGSLRQHVLPEGQPMLANLRDCVASLSELLSDLLDLSKLEAGVVKANEQDFELDEVVAPLIAAHAAEASVKGLQLRARRSVRRVRTDPVLLRRIVGNFLANAVDYTARGGVLVGCRRHAGKDWLEVWDSGIGIPEERIPEVFEEFKQLGDQARTRGSGLGLAIAARTARLLGLEIRVRSRPGRGSLFAIELPPGEAAGPVLAPPPPVPVRQSLHIALVEDNRVVREALRLCLQGAGHRVCAGASGAALREALAGARPDLVVSDYRLQGETGFQVVAALRETYGAELPALLLTGDTDPALVRSMADRGIVVLHKPVGLETLLACIADATGPLFRTPSS